MKATLKLFATLSRFLPAEAQRTSRVEVDLGPGTTVQGLIDRYRIPPDLCALVLVNGLFVDQAERAARILAENDTVAIWPPVGGG
ncbi:MAG TPA: MoaD/ThiS family protein [Holophaga sp.]|nr:MoaD/ThiS family protein [Holophaga sp.]